MSRRPVQFNDALAYPEDGRAARSLLESLLELGLPPENLRAAEALFVAGAMELAQKHQERWLRELLKVLGEYPAGVALRRALIGAEGRTLAEDADAVGCDRSNLYRAEQRIRRRLAKIGQQPTHSVEAT